MCRHSGGKHQQVGVGESCLRKKQGYQLTCKVLPGCWAGGKLADIWNRRIHYFYSFVSKMDCALENKFCFLKELYIACTVGKQDRDGIL